MKIFSLLTFPLFITACAHANYPVTSPYYAIPVGSRLILKKTLTIPAESGRVYIQQGKAIASHKKDPYLPHCWFVSWKISDTDSQIAVDKFIVISADKDERHISALSSMQLAGAPSLSLSGMMTETSIMEFATVLMIRSDRQKDIRQFTCSHWAEASSGRHLTVLEINEALNGIAELSVQ